MAETARAEDRTRPVLGRDRRARGPRWDEAMRLAFATGDEAARARASALAGSSAPVPLAEAFGRTLAEDLRALFDVPHYDSSAMDGYAVSGPPPWTLDDTGSAFASCGQGTPGPW